LTLTSGVPVTTTDVNGATTLYFTPFNGNTIPLWNTSTSAWEVQTFTEKSISVSALTANTMYDIYASNNNNGTFSLTTTAWTNVSTRATTNTLQDGVYIQTGSLGKRYLGSFFVGTGSVTYDAIQARWLWNRYNRVHRKLESGDTSNTSYTLVGLVTGTWQYCRNTVGTSQCSFVVGQLTEPTWISVSNYAAIPSGGVYVGTGVNISFNSPSTAATISNGFRIGGQNSVLQSGGFINTNYMPSTAGLLLLTQLEYAENGTLTFFPGASTSNITQRSAITALVWG